jgi:hypothetical protein
MHAFPLTGIGGGDGSRIWVFLRDAWGERASLLFLAFFADDLRIDSGEAAEAFFLRLFFVAALGASGDVDISRSGSR